VVQELEVDGISDEKEFGDRKTDGGWADGAASAVSIFSSSTRSTPHQGGAFPKSEKIEPLLSGENGGCHGQEKILVW
jgi:hypothetical protein